MARTSYINTTFWNLSPEQPSNTHTNNPRSWKLFICLFICSLPDPIELLPFNLISTEKCPLWHLLILSLTWFFTLELKKKKKKKNNPPNKRALEYLHEWCHIWCDWMFVMRVSRYNWIKVRLNVLVLLQMNIAELQLITPVLGCAAGECSEPLD